MSRTWPITTLTRRDAVAIFLFVLGLFGMVRHFSAKPETASAPARRATASTFTAPAIPRFSANADASSSSKAVQAMRRRLREFVIPWPNTRSLPVSDALAHLQHHWQTLPHETDAIPPATFSLSESAAQQIAAANPAALVSLEIPGVSLLTQLQLLAAQTELQLRITESGAIFETSEGLANSKSQSTVLRLDALTLQRFTSRAQRIFNELGGNADESARRDNFLSHPSGVDIQVQLLKKTEVQPFTTDLEATATVPDAGYTIDPDLAPEVIDFEDFYNYGSPIHTTGINALGESEPVVLTDSKILQPVFATRLLGH